jgi:hypothetical protein
MFKDACTKHDKQHAEWREQKDLADRVLRGDPAAYIEVIKELNPFSEISDLGSTVRFEILSAHLVTADIEVHGEAAVPREIKSLPPQEWQANHEATPQGRILPAVARLHLQLRAPGRT